MTEQGIKILDRVEYNQLVGLSGLNLTTEVNSNNYMSVFYHYKYES